MKQRILAYMKDETGQTSTEYILLVAVAAGMVIKFKNQIELRLTSLISKVFDTTENNVMNDLF